MTATQGANPCATIPPTARKPRHASSDSPCSPTADACRVDTDTLASLLRDIDDPALRRRLTRICIAVMECDAHVSEGEATLLGTAVEQWGLHSEMLEPRADRYEPVERPASPAGCGQDARLAA